VPPADGAQQVSGLHLQGLVFAQAEAAKPGRPGAMRLLRGRREANRGSPYDPERARIPFA